MSGDGGQRISLLVQATLSATLKSGLNFLPEERDELVGINRGGDIFEGEDPAESTMADRTEKKSRQPYRTTGSIPARKGSGGKDDLRGALYSGAKKQQRRPPYLTSKSSAGSSSSKEQAKAFKRESLPGALFLPSVGKNMKNSTSTPNLGEMDGM